MRGACFCNAVSYEVTGEPNLSAFCHCTNCQRLSGKRSPFMTPRATAPSSLRLSPLSPSARSDHFVLPPTLDRLPLCPHHPLPCQRLHLDACSASREASGHVRNSEQAVQDALALQGVRGVRDVREREGRQLQRVGRASRTRHRRKDRRLDAVAAHGPHFLWHENA